MNIIIYSSIFILLYVNESNYNIGFVHYIANHKNLPISLVCQRFVDYE